MGSLNKRLGDFVKSAAEQATKASFGKRETDGTYTLIAPGGDDFVYVTYGGRADGYGGTVSIARSTKAATPVMPVLLKNRLGAAIVADVDNTRRSEYTDQSLSLIEQHSHRIGFGMVDAVEGLRFEPGLAHPIKIAGAYGLSVVIEAFIYKYGGELAHFPKTVFDLTAYLPGAGKTAWVAVAVDPATGLPTAASGTEYTIGADMTPDLIAGINLSGLLPLVAVILEDGQTQIANIAHFFDIRPYIVYTGDFENVWQNMSSALRLWGGEFTDNLDGTIDVSAGQGMIKADETDYETRPTALLEGQGSAVTVVSWSAVADLALTDNALNHIYYDGSAADIAATNTYDDISDTRDFIIGHVYRDGTTLYVHGAGLDAWNWYRRLQHFGEEYLKIVLANGGAVAETGNRYLTVTPASVFFEIMREYNLSAYDTSGADTFTYWFRDGLGGWDTSGGETQIDNTNYDDNSGAPTALINAHYGVHWVYLNIDDSLHVVYGQDDYATVAQAKAAEPPAALPGPITYFGVLIAKIIVQKSAANLYLIEAPTRVMFSLSAISDHGELSGLADDDHTQYALNTHSFVTMAAEARFSAERVLTAGSGIGLTDGGAGSTATVALNITGLTEDTAPDPANDLLVTYDNSAAAYKKVKPSSFYTQTNYIANESSDYTTTSTAAFEDIDSTNFSRSITTTGGIVLVHLHAAVQVTGNASLGNVLWIDFEIDGTPHGGDDGIVRVAANVGVNEGTTISFTRLITGLSNASHTFTLIWKVRLSDGAIMYAGAGTTRGDMHPQFWVMELR